MYTKKKQIKAYSVGLLMLTFLDKWKKTERIKAATKIRNAITAKHDNLHAQIQNVGLEKNKINTNMCCLFVHADTISVSVQEELIPFVKDIKFSTSAVLHNLYRLNREEIKKTYGLDEKIFIQVDVGNIQNITPISSKVARMIAENIIEAIDKRIFNNQKTKEKR